MISSLIIFTSLIVNKIKRFSVLLDNGNKSMLSLHLFSSIVFVPSFVLDSSFDFDIVLLLRLDFSHSHEFGLIFAKLEFWQYQALGLDGLVALEVKQQEQLAF